MFSVREPRLLTALAVIAASLYTMSMGVEFTRFALAEMSADDEALGKRVAPWTNAPGIAALARRDVVFEPADAKERLAATADLLSRAPLDSSAWALLAELHFASGAPLEKVVRALAISNLTGPNEGWVMAMRATFALPLWQALPAESRRWAVSDLVGGWPAISDEQRMVMRVALRQQAAQTREEIRAALLHAGDAASPVAATLGLGAAQQNAPSNDGRKDAEPGDAGAGDAK